MVRTPKEICIQGCYLGVWDKAMTDDFFRNRLDQMIHLRHPLAVLANLMLWQEIEASLAQRSARQVKAGKKIEDLDLFGAVSGQAHPSCQRTTTLTAREGICAKPAAVAIRS